MDTEIRESFTTGMPLRFALYGLEIALGAPLAGVECERIFRDAENDQVSAKDYVLLQTPQTTVLATVDEYEPETVSIIVRGRKIAPDLLRRLRDAADCHVVRLRSVNGEHA